MTFFAKGKAKLENIPEFTEGKAAHKLYVSGAGLCDDSNGVTADTSYVCCYRGVKKEAVDSYIRQLRSQGYRKEYDSVFDNRLCYTLSDGTHRCNITYLPKKSVLRLVEDRSSNCSVEEFEYFYTPKAGENPAIYQYGLYYAPDRRIDGTCTDCGMLYIIRLSDNSVVLVDAGQFEQATDAAVEELMRLLREITGTPAGEKVRIAAWYCTHAHDDHMVLFGKLLRVYHEQISLERVMFNFPSQQNFGMHERIAVVRNRITEFFPDVKFLRLSTGLSFSLADAQFDVLYTHEDGVDARTGETKVRGFNNTSTILKVTLGGKTFMILGDISNIGEKIATANISANLFKADIVQVAHHGFNAVKKLYRLISARYALWPQTFSHTQLYDMNIYNLVSTYTPGDKIFFAGQGTYGLEIANGDISVSIRPVVGGEYDGSEI